MMQMLSTSIPLSPSGRPMMAVPDHTIVGVSIPTQSGVVAIVSGDDLNMIGITPVVSPCIWYVSLDPGIYTVTWVAPGCTPSNGHVTIDVGQLGRVYIGCPTEIAGPAVNTDRYNLWALATDYFQGSSSFGAGIAIRNGRVSGEMTIHFYRWGDN